jgi:endonuclease/exonuclease/phosphatase family metal-dependent hydrolase
MISWTAKLIILAIFAQVSSYALSISSYNIRNFDANSAYSTDLEVLLKQIKEVNSEISVFQEIVDTQGFRELIRRNFKNKRILISSCGGFAKQKLALVYDTRKYSFVKSSEDTSFSKEVNCNRGVRPLFKVQLKSKETRKNFWALLVHLKAGATKRDIEFRKKQILLLSKTLKNMKRYIILGDFNTTKINTNEGKYFSDFINSHNLVSSSDTVRCSSFWSGGLRDGLYYPSKLDHILVSKDLNNLYDNAFFTTYSHCKKVSCRVSTAAELGDTYTNVSDHCPIKLELQ